ncbi:MAG TPA: pyridoxamine 5'-phosphate oxidase family protein [Thermoanaerobaculia bacterium]|nr:pyridoxamine 5'-phosphate oxidase family protein [Thermoanaerobaculia bacterium]
MMKAVSSRTTVKRLPKRGNYDPAVIHAILDEGLVCHVGFVVDGAPFVIPMVYARDGERLILHGSNASRLMRIGATEVELCVTVTLLDGLVLARSAFNHSMNYRSAVVFGRATAITDTAEKRLALDRIVEHVARGRTAEARAANDRELGATTVLSMPLAEASAKIRTGGVGDDEEDYTLPVWAGVLPLRVVADLPIADERLAEGVSVPEYVRDYRRPGGKRLSLHEATASTEA